jgi:sulfatase modifying factor 1
MKRTLVCILTMIIVITGCPDKNNTNDIPDVKAASETTVAVGDISFTMSFVPGKTFFTGTDDQGKATVDAFSIAQTEVTYELWSVVYDWATDGNGDAVGEGRYRFAHPGIMGDGSGDTEQHPVTNISWRDAMIWTNALSEYCNAQNNTNLECVYYTDSAYNEPKRIVDDSKDLTADIPGSQDAPYVKTDASGFRLPTSNEFELAARYISDSNNDGDIMDSGEFYPGNYASGAAADTTDSKATGEVAWYRENSGFGTQKVGMKKANALRLYDMSGNVMEWCFEWYPNSNSSVRVRRGGGWFNFPSALEVGNAGKGGPCFEVNFRGFRFVRSP